MSSILFLTWDGGGNLPPALAIASELRDRGHDVRFLGHAGQARRVEDAGLGFAAYPSARPFTSQDPGSPLRLLGTLGDRAMGRDVIDDLAAHPADLVVVDALLFAAMEALRDNSVSYAVLGHCFDGFLRRAARGPMGLLLRLRGYRPLALIDAGRARIVTTIEELDEGHGDVTHVGGIARGVPAHPEEPLVLLSLSTFSFPGLGRTWQRLLDAVDGLPARVVATTGPAVDPETLRAPGNVEVHRWLPHAEVMPRASLVVGHGGLGTTMAALAHGLPLLVLPQDATSDQPLVGKAIERAGAGLVMSRRSAPAKLRAAMVQLLGDGPHRRAASSLGARVREQDGRARGADILESLVSDATRS